jgi:hypothetical protein
MKTAKKYPFVRVWFYYVGLLLAKTVNIYPYKRVIVISFLV